MRHLLAAGLVFIVSGSSAFAFDPCGGARRTAQHATQDSIARQASAQAATEGLAEGAPEHMQRVLALMRTPMPAMQTEAAADQAAADKKTQDCEAAAALAPHPGSP